ASRNVLATATAAVPIANNDSGTTFGYNINTSSSGIVGNTNASGINRTLAVANVNTWKLYAVAHNDATFTQDLWDLTAGANDHFTGTGTRTLAASSNWWIGANPRTAIGAAACDIAFVGMIKGQAITTAIANQYAANIRANLALRGLTVP